MLSPYLIYFKLWLFLPASRVANRAWPFSPVFVPSRTGLPSIIGFHCFPGWLFRFHNNKRTVIVFRSWSSFVFLAQRTRSTRRNTVPKILFRKYISPPFKVGLTESLALAFASALAFEFIPCSWECTSIFHGGTLPDNIFDQKVISYGLPIPTHLL